MKCQFIKSDKAQCQANALVGKNFCFRHSPDTKIVRELASSKGGQNRSLQGVYGASVRLTSAKDAQDFLGQVINSVWTGKVPMKLGSSMGFLVRCWLDTYNEVEIERRLDVIEEKLEMRGQL